jgi:hypothetical protein
VDEDDGWAAAGSGGGEVQETMENLRKGNRAREKENQRRVRHGWGRGKTARSLRGGRTRQLRVERLRKRTDRRRM